jgi:CHAT domain-containing protein
MAFCLCLASANPIQPAFRPGHFSIAVQAQDSAPQVEDGIARYRAGDYQGAIALWQEALERYQGKPPDANQMILLENLARVHRLIGRSADSVEYWQRAIQIAEVLEDVQQAGRLLTEQAQTYSQLGQHRQAIELLCRNPSTEADCANTSAVGLAQSAGDLLGEAAALGSLGESLRLWGDYEGAIAALEKSLGIMRELSQPGYQVSALSSLGAVYTSKAQVSYRLAESASQAGDEDEEENLSNQAQEDDQTARGYFETSQQLAHQQGDTLAEVRAYLSLVSVYRRLNEAALALAAQESARQLLPVTPDSHGKVYATITLANLIQSTNVGDSEVAIAQCFRGSPDAQAQILLTGAIRQAQQLGDSRGEAFALGTLGHWYECQQDYAQALQLTQQAQWVADQQLQGRDNLYLWQWQTGRIFLAQGQTAEAIQAYEQAVATLNGIRSDLLISDRNLQFDFRDIVDPVYRELIALQLAGAAAPKNVAQPLVGADPAAALVTLDSLKLAELQNYFGSDCEIVPFAQTQLGLVGANSGTAVLTSVLLGDRTAIIASLPNGDRQVAWIPSDDATLRETINAYRRELERASDELLNQFDPTLGQRIYDWLIRPFSDNLAVNQVETLVFVNDGILRSIPMAALHDGQRFLIETYAIATIPALSLTAARPLEPQQMRVLLGGLTEQVKVGEQNFRALVHVNEEVMAIQNQVPNSQLLLNQDFTLERLNQELNNSAYSILHMATHGQFRTEPEDTFLVTGGGEKLTLAAMERLIRSTASSSESIDLLALTACQTAIGDERAALGLGGVAVRAGAKSALATLWSINDQATAQLSAQFYRGLASGQMSKAKALQVAQISLIQENRHPAHWSPYVLIGSWL